jgi:hypothetical protein
MVSWKNGSVTEGISLSAKRGRLLAEFFNNPWEEKRI